MIGHVDGVDYFDNITRNPAITSQDWKNAWQTAVGGKEFTSTSGLKYRTSTKWAGENYSIDDIANNLMANANGYTELMIIALGENEPALTYHVGVSTNAQPGSMYLRNNEPVYNTVHTRVTKGQWPAGNKLNATVWLNYKPGNGTSAQPAKAVRHDFTINHVGDTNTPQFTPADFGWKNGWAIGTYWFDITIAKQNGMDTGINTPDREKSETFTLTNYGLNATTGVEKQKADLYNNEPVHDSVG